jgi:hypothetical protein
MLFKQKILMLIKTDRSFRPEFDNQSLKSDDDQVRPDKPDETNCQKGQRPFLLGIV